MESKKLNINVPKAVSDLEEATQKFELTRIIYKIIFRGRGLEFDSYRNYDEGDDSSHIDWKASKRANKLLVKQYIEERDLKIIFAIDVSERMVFGSTDKLKCEYAAEVISALAHLILTTGDNVGFILYNDEVINFVPPAKGTNQFHLLVDNLSNASIYKGESNTSKALEFILDNLDDSISAVILVSDFLNIGKQHERNFGFLSSRFETVSLMIKDPLDRTLPDIDEEVFIEHPVTKDIVLINPKISKKVYEKFALQQENLVKEMFRKIDIDTLQITTDKYFVIPLVEFLKERVIKKGRTIL